MRNTAVSPAGSGEKLALACKESTRLYGPCTVSVVVAIAQEYKKSVNVPACVL
jgi:hypothetical protein